MRQTYESQNAGPTFNVVEVGLADLALKHLGWPLGVTVAGPDVVGEADLQGELLPAVGAVVLDVAVGVLLELVLKIKVKVSFSF